VYVKKLLIVLAVLAVSLPAQTTGFAGRVVNAQTQEPILGVTICCYVTNTRTDSSGQYVMADLAPGRYRVRAIKTGYELAYFPESVTVVHGQVSQGINFALVPTGTPQYGAISGTVYDAANMNPIIGAEVRAWNGVVHRGKLQHAAPYLIDSLPPGKYWVSASAAGYQDGHYADSVTVVAGQTTTGICFGLNASGSQTGGVSGMVFDARTREPIVRATVCTGHGGAFTDSSGAYLVSGLAPGRYQVRASASGYEAATHPDSVEVAAGQVTPGICFELEPQGQNTGGITGAVADAHTGQVIEGAIVSAVRGGRVTQVRQGPVGYTILGLEPGRYLVCASATGYEHGVFPESVTVTAGQTTGHVDLALQPTGGGDVGCLSGLVFNAHNREPILGAYVMAAGPTERRANTSQSGEFVMRALPVGLYAVWAHAQGFLPSVPETVEVSAGQMTSITIGLLPAGGGGTGSISGWVHDSTGIPIHRAEVVAMGRQGQGGAVADSLGNYIITGLPTGPYRVRAHAQGYYPAHFPDTVWVVESQTTPDINFQLRPVRALTSGIGGFALDGISQTALPGAVVTAIGEFSSFSTTADACGDYVFDYLEPGEYELTVTADGYTTEVNPEPVRVMNQNITALVCPAAYPLSGIRQNPGRLPIGRISLSITPNPFQGQALVRYRLPGSGMASLKLYDITGKLVRTLVQGTSPAGNYALPLRAAGLTPGVYLVRLDTPGMTLTAKTITH
jgi:protocatechuate 3,4-dioxygenase beta subunit